MPKRTKQATAALVTSRKEAAQQLDVTERQLGNWKKEPGFPDCSQGYDLDAIRKWRETNARKGSKEGKLLRRLKAAGLRQQLRIRRAEADRIERRELEAQGNILNRDVYELFLIESQQKARDRLLRLPKLLCANLPAKFHRTLQAEADKEIRKVLIELARDLEKRSEERRVG